MTKISEFTNELEVADITGTNDYYLYFQSTDGLTDYKVLKSEVFEAIETNITTLSQITSSQNNYSIGNGNIFRISADGTHGITGIVAGYNGRKITIINTGANAIMLFEESSSSSAANRIIVDGLLSNISVRQNGTVELFYDGTTARWRLINYNSACSVIPVP
jgi:hypothetical protein